MNNMSPIPSTARPDSAGRSQIVAAPASLPRDTGASCVLRITYPVEGSVQVQQYLQDRSVA